MTRSWWAPRRARGDGGAGSGRGGGGREGGGGVGGRAAGPRVWRVVGGRRGPPPVEHRELRRRLAAVEAFEGPALDRGGRTGPHVVDAGLAYRRQAYGLRTGADVGESFRNGRTGTPRQIGKAIAKVGEGFQRRLALPPATHFPPPIP